MESNLPTPPCGTSPLDNPATLDDDDSIGLDKAGFRPDPAAKLLPTESRASKVNALAELTLMVKSPSFLALHVHGTME